jgi:hypothetical protein
MFWCVFVRIARCNSDNEWLTSPRMKKYSTPSYQKYHCIAVSNHTKPVYVWLIVIYLPLLMLLRSSSTLRDSTNSHLHRTRPHCMLTRQDLPLQPTHPYYTQNSFNLADACRTQQRIRRLYPFTQLIILHLSLRYDTPPSLRSEVDTLQALALPTRRRQIIVNTYLRHYTFPFELWSHLSIQAVDDTVTQLECPRV